MPRHSTSRKKSYPRKKDYCKKIAEKYIKTNTEMIKKYKNVNLLDKMTMEEIKNLYFLLASYMYVSESEDPDLSELKKHI